uniref:cytochrome P450 310a1-like n=1 Tax=Lucilia cuprina TaxID=7375 RepID=UPI001F4F944A|nr:cytochrome P450 310a1-like [Lucilia cuprina]
MWLLIPILIYAVVFLSVRHVYNYWRRKGFPHEKSDLSWPFLKQIYKREFHFVDAISEAYRAGKERFVGIYLLFHPTLLIRDLSLARELLENSSGHFNDTKWDYVRGYRKYNLMDKIAPIFSAARLEAMLSNIEKVGDYALNYMDVVADCNPSDGIDMQEIMRMYSVSIIANLIYGSEIDLFKQTDSIFQQYLNYSIRQSAVNSYTYNRIPKNTSLTYRLRDVVRENVERREEGGTIRKDILQVLVKFRNGNDIEHKEKLSWHIENLFEREKLLSIKKLTHITEHLLENGMNTMASTGVLALYEILQQPELKHKIIDELRTHIQLNKDKKPQITYENLKQLKLMDLCLQETVRKYPSVAYIERICRKDFQLPKSKHTLREGKSFIIPLLAIQRDEKYFEDPLSFKPQRFLQDSNGNKGECLLSFGLGAKTCIAEHFVNLVVKCLLVKLFFNFHMETIPSENFEICYNKTPFIQSKEGFRVKLKSTKIKFDL